LSDDTERLPRFAASAAPAAICCFFDFAGIQKQFASQMRNGFDCRAVPARTRACHAVGHRGDRRRVQARASLHQKK
jgi:hypothetical protein